MGIVRSIKSSKKVFIVEDSPLYREVLKEEISAIQDVEIQAFASAEACLAKISEEPELIILDFYLDGENENNMSGHEALKEFQKADTPPEILFVSAAKNEGLLEEYQNYRNVDFVLKKEAGTEYLVHKVRQKLNKV